MNLLNIEHVTKIFGEKRIFDDVSYGIHAGDKIGIIGINGTGKTTLLKIIAGLEEPDEGQVICQNGLRITYLPQNPEFPEGAKVLDYVIAGKHDQDWNTESEAKSILNKLDIKVLSWDNYSLLEGSGIRTEYFHNFEVMAGKNLPLWYTMLSAGHNATYATPTADELRWQMAVAMTYGVQNIDHYTYTSHEDDYSCMVEYETWNPTELYYDIKTVNNEYLAWDHIYMAYKWQGVGAYDAGTSNAMLTMLENKLNLTNYGLTVASSNEDLLVGVFDHNGNKAYMITNAGSAGTTKVGEGKNFAKARHGGRAEDLHLHIFHLAFALFYT